MSACRNGVLITQPRPVPQKIPRRKLANEILDRLLQTIERGEVEPGGFLPSERDLMARFGVGRPAVRKALLALAGMGVIQIQHGERARRVSLGPRTVLDQIDRSVRHLRGARLWFETGMVRLAARNATANDVAQLRIALDSQRAVRGEAAVSGNPIYFELFPRLLRVPGVEDLTLQEHEGSWLESPPAMKIAPCERWRRNCSAPILCTNRAARKHV